MKKRTYPPFALSAGLLILFILYTAAVQSIDVKPIGPQNSLVGFSALNQWVHNTLGVNMTLYQITDWLSIIALLPVAGFAILGFVQLVKGKSLLRVDNSILALGGFYFIVLAAYAFFEFNIINYRPILIRGILEASYPSSTTMLVLCIMPTAMMQFSRRLQSKSAKIRINSLCGAFTAFMVIGRLFSGVHWCTDILGGILLSAALVMLYFSVVRFIDAKCAR